jgi:hypothetical protein
MIFPRPISSEAAERLLSIPERDGETPELAQVANFVAALPAAVARNPDPEVGAMVVSRAAEAARAATLEAAQEANATLRTSHRAPSWQRRVAVIALAIALVPAATAGLAIAGVPLPDPARDAFESVGIDLPNQSDADDANPAGAEDGDDGDEATGSNGGRAEGDQGGESAGSQGQSKQAGNGGGAAGNGGGAAGNGGDGGGHSGRSQGGGPESTPPGHGATPPGQGGVPPGQGAPPPGHEEPPPGQSDVAPGASGTAPGHTGAAPGQGGVPPGQGGVPPGQAKPKKPK